MSNTVRILAILFLSPYLFFSCTHKREELKQEGDLKQKEVQDHILESTVKIDTSFTYNDSYYALILTKLPSALVDEFVKPNSNTANDNLILPWRDNVINLKINKDNKSFLYTEIKKSFFKQIIPSDFLEKAIIEGVWFESFDKNGISFSITVCKPDTDICYFIGLIVDYTGKISLENRTDDDNE